MTWEDTTFLLTFATSWEYRKGVCVTISDEIISRTAIEILIWRDVWWKFLKFKKFTLLFLHAKLQYSVWKMKHWTLNLLTIKEDCEIWDNVKVKARQLILNKTLLRRNSGKLNNYTLQTVQVFKFTHKKSKKDVKNFSQMSCYICYRHIQENT